MNSAFATAALLRPVASCLQHLELALGQAAQRRAGLLVLAGQQPLDDLGVERGAAARHVVQGPDQVVDLR